MSKVVAMKPKKKERFLLCGVTLSVVLQRLDEEGRPSGQVSTTPFFVPTAEMGETADEGMFKKAFDDIRKQATLETSIRPAKKEGK